MIKDHVAWSHKYPFLMKHTDESEFGINHMNPLIHPALCKHYAIESANNSAALEAKGVLPSTKQVYPIKMPLSVHSNEVMFPD